MAGGKGLKSAIGSLIELNISQVKVFCLWDFLAEQESNGKEEYQN